MPDDPTSLNLARIVFKLLTDPRGWRIAELKAELGIKDRTYRKYRKLIEEFAPFRRGAGSLVRVIEDGGDDWLRLVEPERAAPGPELVARMAAHHLTLQVFGFLGNADLRTSLENAAAEFRGRVRARDRNHVNHVLRNLDRILYCVPDAPKDYEGHEHVLNQVLLALTYTQQIRVAYATDPHDVRERILEPLTLALWRSGLYLFARFADDPKERVYNFAVDRMLDVQRLPTHYTYPAANVYSPEAVMDGAFGIFVPTGRRSSIDVELIFEDIPWLQRFITERRWSRSQQFTSLSHGRLKMEFRVSTMVEVWPWIRQWGSAVQVVRPTGEDPEEAPRGARTSHGPARAARSGHASRRPR